MAVAAGPARPRTDASYGLGRLRQRMAVATRPTTQTAKSTTLRTRPTTLSPSTRSS